MEENLIHYSLYGLKGDDIDAMVKYIEEINAQFVYDVIQPTYVFNFGGDGRMLNAVHYYIDDLSEITFVGIKTGTLGFYTDFIKEEIAEALNLIVNGGFKINSYKMLYYHVKGHNSSGNPLDLSGYVLNDIAITNPIKTAIFDVIISEELMETFRGTGLLLSTPSGSTAYNKSLKGAMIDEGLECYQLTEIAPIENRVFRALDSSLILNKNEIVQIIPKHQTDLFLSCDAKKIDINEIELLEVGLSDKEAYFLTKENRSYLKRIHDAFIEK